MYISLCGLCALGLNVVLYLVFKRKSNKSQVKSTSFARSGESCVDFESRMRGSVKSKAYREAVHPMDLAWHPNH